MAKTPYTNMVSNATSTSTEGDTSVSSTTAAAEQIPVETTAQEQTITTTNTTESAPTEETKPTVTVTDNSGINVEKPVVEKNEAAKETAIVTTDNANKIVVDALIENYLKFNDGSIMRTEETKLRAGHMFREILKHGLENPQTDVLDSIYMLFKEHQNRILMPTIVMPTVYNIPKKVAERILCFYTMFKMLVSEPTELNDAVVRNMLAGIDTNKIELIIMYFTNKKSTM